MLLIKGGYVKPITGEDMEDGEVLVDGEPVSYTHLTLPTILLV